MVLTGRQALRTIRQRIDRAKADYDEIARYVRELEALHASALDEEREVLTDLAQTYLPQLTHDAMVGGLTQIRAGVADVIRRRDQRRAALRQEIEDHLSQLAEADSALAAEKAWEVAIQERVAECREMIASALGNDDEYRGRAEEHEALMARRDKLKARRGRLLAIASAERPAYEAFTPFRYLRERGFGEPEYRSGWISRLFDRWLAKRIDFPKLDRNHRLLKVGPHQIQAEILRISRRAGELEGMMDEAEQAAAIGHGLPKTLEELSSALDDVAKARQQRDAVRAEYEAREQELREIEAHHGQHYEEALELHRQHLGGKSIVELEKLARETASGKDDRLVERLDDVRLRLEHIEKRGKERVEELAVAREKIDGLLRLEESGRRDFGSFGAYFREGFAIDPLLDRFMSGDTKVSTITNQMNAALVSGSVIGSVAESMLGGILSEVAAAFSADPPRPFSEERDTVVSVMFHDVDGSISRRVTRRKASRGGEG